MLGALHNSLTNEKISQRLRVRMWLFNGIALVLCVLILEDVWRGDATWWSALIALIVGFAVGTPLGRLRTVKWHETRDEIVTQLDWVGGAAIVVYLLLDESRDWLLGHWFSGTDLTTIAFAVLAGALIGRFYGMHLSIQRVLKAPPTR